MSAITDLRRALRDQLPHLAARVVPAPAEYDPRGLDTLLFCVTILLGDDTPDHQDKLDTLLDPDADDGVKSLLEADRALNGLAADVAVVQSSGYEIHQATPESTPVLGATWTVRVMRA